MRENRQSGSAGGEAGTTGLPYPDFNYMNVREYAPVRYDAALWAAANQRRVGA